MSKSIDFLIRKKKLVDEIIAEIVLCLHLQNAKTISFKNPIKTKTKNCLDEILGIDESQIAYSSEDSCSFKDLEITDLIAILTQIKVGENIITETLREINFKSRYIN